MLASSLPSILPRGIFLTCHWLTPSQLLTSFPINFPKQSCILAGWSHISLFMYLSWTWYQWRWSYLLQKNCLPSCSPGSQNSNILRNFLSFTVSKWQTRVPIGGVCVLSTASGPSRALTGSFKKPETATREEGGWGHLGWTFVTLAFYCRPQGIRRECDDGNFLSDKTIPVSFKLMHWSQVREIPLEIKQMPILEKCCTKALRLEAISISESQHILHKPLKTGPLHLIHCPYRIFLDNGLLFIRSWNWLRTFLQEKSDSPPHPPPATQIFRETCQTLRSPLKQVYRLN